MQNLIFNEVKVLFNGELFNETPLITLVAPYLESDQKLNGTLLTPLVSFSASSIKPIAIKLHPHNGLLNEQVSS